MSGMPLSMDFSMLESISSLNRTTGGHKHMTPGKAHPLSMSSQRPSIRVSHLDVSDGSMSNLERALEYAKKKVDDELRVFISDIAKRLNLPGAAPPRTPPKSPVSPTNAYPSTFTSFLMSPESSRWEQGALYLKDLAEKCLRMRADEFGSACEDIVHDLNMARQQLPMGTLKQLHMKMLFILTRCTRLLQSQKEAEAEMPYGGVYGGPYRGAEVLATPMVRNRPPGLPSTLRSQASMAATHFSSYTASKPLERPAELPAGHSAELPAEQAAEQLAEKPRLQRQQQQQQHQQQQAQPPQRPIIRWDSCPAPADWRVRDPKAEQKGGAGLGLGARKDEGKQRSKSKSNMMDDWSAAVAEMRGALDDGTYVPGGDFNQEDSASASASGSASSGFGFGLGAGFGSGLGSGSGADGGSGLGSVSGLGSSSSSQLAPSSSSGLGSSLGLGSGSGSGLSSSKKKLSGGLIGGVTSLVRMMLAPGADMLIGGQQAHMAGPPASAADAEVHGSTSARGLLWGRVAEIRKEEEIQRAMRSQSARDKSSLSRSSDSSPALAPAAAAVAPAVTAVREMGPAGDAEVAAALGAALSAAGGAEPGVVAALSTGAGAGAAGTGGAWGEAGDTSMAGGSMAVPQEGIKGSEGMEGRKGGQGGARQGQGDVRREGESDKAHRRGEGRGSRAWDVRVPSGEDERMESRRHGVAREPPSPSGNLAEDFDDLHEKAMMRSVSGRRVQYKYGYWGKGENEEEEGMDGMVPNEGEQECVVICRICEEEVNVTQLQEHSRLCALANRCDSAQFSIDDRLRRLADGLDHISNEQVSRLSAMSFQRVPSNSSSAAGGAASSVVPAGLDSHSQQVGLMGVGGGAGAKQGGGRFLSPLGSSMVSHADMREGDEGGAAGGGGEGEGERTDGYGREEEQMREQDSAELCSRENGSLHPGVPISPTEDHPEHQDHPAHSMLQEHQGAGGSSSSNVSNWSYVSHHLQQQQQHKLQQQQHLQAAGEEGSQYEPSMSAVTSMSGATSTSGFLSAGTASPMPTSPAGSAGTRGESHGGYGSPGSSLLKSALAGGGRELMEEHIHMVAQEEIALMDDLADIAQDVADVSLEDEKPEELLLTDMRDLTDLLRTNDARFLTIDVFGRRITKLLQEKYYRLRDILDHQMGAAAGSALRGYGGPDGGEAMQYADEDGEDVLQLSRSARSTPPNASLGGGSSIGAGGSVAGGGGGGGGGGAVAASSSSASAAGRDRTTIDDFELIKPISKGAYGRVFLAKKKTTGDLFAIKVLRKADMVRKNAVESVQAERNILASVRSPFVVRCFYSFTCRENLYLVMEYLNGGDLFSLLQNLGCLEEPMARAYIAELMGLFNSTGDFAIGPLAATGPSEPPSPNVTAAAAAAAASASASAAAAAAAALSSHPPAAMGFPKSGSIDSGASVSASIPTSPLWAADQAADFPHAPSGASSHPSSSSGRTSPYSGVPGGVGMVGGGGAGSMGGGGGVGGMGGGSASPAWKAEVESLQGAGRSASADVEKKKEQTVGTPDYLAPEILLGTGHGATADWWAVGVMLFELLCGVPPFNAPSPEIIFDNILNRDIPWPEVPEEMSYEAMDLIDKLLHPEPSLRLGARGAEEVKAHPFFAGIRWETLAQEQAAFVPSPDSPHDTGYFLTRGWQQEPGGMDGGGMAMGMGESESASSDACSSTSADDFYQGEQGDEPGDMRNFSDNVAAAFTNFSFKVRARVHAHDARVHAHDARVHAHDARAHAHDARVHAHDARVHAHDARVHAHDARVHAHDARVHAHDARVHAHDAHVHAHDARVHAHDARVHAHDARAHAHDARVHAHDAHAHDARAHAHDAHSHAHADVDAALTPPFSSSLHSPPLPS
ncbi:unnamed protein product [Closterium sp. Yama58-4]|nr:unnamed protein product [Closterium sp. Yama58-4]